MIHLDQVEKSLACIFAGMRFMRAPRLRSHRRFRPNTARNLSQKPLDRFLAWDQIGGKPMISVIRVEQAPNLPRRFRARWRDHLERDFLDQRLDGSPHLGVDPVRSDRGSARFWSERFRDRMQPEARGQRPYPPLFQAGCLGNRLNLSRRHRAAKRYMSPEVRVERQSRLKRFEAPPRRRRRLALNHGTGSPTIFAARGM